MKKRLLNALFLLLLSAVWLFPFDTMMFAEWILAAGFFAAVLCLVLIPRRVAALCAAAAVSLGTVFYDVRFLAGMAPAVFVTALAFAAGEADAAKPLKKDAYALTLLLAGAAALTAAFVSAFASENAVMFAFDGAYVWLAAAAAAAVCLLVRALRAAPVSAARKGRPARFPEAAAALYILLILCLLSGALFSTKQVMNVRVWTYPAFLAAVCAFTVPNPATRGLFGKAAA